MMNQHWIIQVHDKPAIGKPRWRRVFLGDHSALSQKTANAAADKLRTKNPQLECRVRKANRER